MCVDVWGVCVWGGGGGEGGSLGISQEGSYCLPGRKLLLINADCNLI